MTIDAEPADLGNWSSRAYHRRWLLQQADGLFDFFQRRAINPKGGFYEFDAAGVPLSEQNATRGLHATCRMIHCFAIGMLLGRPGSDDIVDHGMRYLWRYHRDARHGGYIWMLDDNGAKDGSKQGYGHAFVLLAASSAKLIGHPLADDLLSDVTEVLNTRFWDDAHGAIAEEFNQDWSPIDGGAYRGQNSNMHLTEALMAAFEATGDSAYLDKAERIADLIIRRSAGAADWRVAEHFDRDWNVDRDYRGNEMFRPSGTTPGHSLEWARLMLQLWVLGGRKHDWMPDAAQALFSQAISLGWDSQWGGMFYTLDWNDSPAKRNKLWWPMCEGAGAAHFLNAHRPAEATEQAYRKFWNVIARNFIDYEKGGWHEELTEELKPAHTLFPGKGDIYHALQACLIPLFPAEGSLARMIADSDGNLRL